MDIFNFLFHNRDFKNIYDLFSKVKEKTELLEQIETLTSIKNELTSQVIYII